MFMLLKRLSGGALLGAALALVACGGGGGSPGNNSEQTISMPSQQETHPEFLDSGLLRDPYEMTFIADTGKSVPSAVLMTPSGAFKVRSRRSYFVTDETGFSHSMIGNARPLSVEAFEAGSVSESGSLVKFFIDTDGKIIQSIPDPDFGWSQQVLKGSGFLDAELTASGIPKRWLGTWVSYPGGLGATNDWSMLHVDSDRIVQLQMFSNSSRANPEVKLGCVVDSVMSPQQFINSAEAPRREWISGELRAVYLRYGREIYSRKSTATQTRNETNYSRYNYEDFDLTELKNGFKKSRALRVELCDMMVRDLDQKQLTDYQGKDLLTGVPLSVYDDFDWDQCLGVGGPTGEACRERVSQHQDGIDETIRKSASNIWRETYPTFTKRPSQFYYHTESEGKFCDFSDDECVLVHSLLWLNSQMYMMQFADMSFLTLPEVKLALSEAGVRGDPETMLSEWQDAIQRLDQVIEHLRLEGVMPEQAVNVVYPSDLADPRYDVRNSGIAVDQLNDYRKAVNTYRDPDHTEEVREGVMREFFGKYVTSLDGVLQNDIDSEITLDIDMRKEVYEYEDWLDEQPDSNSSTNWRDYRNSTGTLPVSDNNNLGFHAWCQEHPSGCGCPNQSVCDNPGKCACMQ
jgi:hypothetical protein